MALPTQHGRNTHILIIEDEEPQGRFIARMLANAGFGVTSVADADQGIQSQRAQPADLVLVDLVMPGKNGLEFIAELHADFPAVPVIVMTAGGLNMDSDSLALTQSLGATGNLLKPFTREQLLAAVKAALANPADLPPTTRE